MVNIPLGDIFGPYTGHDARQLLDTFDGSPLQKRAVQRFVSGVEQRDQETLNATLRASAAQLHEIADLLDNRAIELKGDMQKVIRRLKSGRTNAAQARKEIARIGTAKRELSERAEQLRHDDAALQEMAAMDPADYVGHLLETTPALKRQLPVLTPDMLNAP